MKSRTVPDFIRPRFHQKEEKMAKVLLLNGSPRVHGCTATALEEMEKTLRLEIPD